MTNEELLHLRMFRNTLRNHKDKLTRQQLPRFYVSTL
nr:MAG TPA: hypothetical protein [Caudoviricetes sp.]